MLHYFPAFETQIADRVRTECEKIPDPSHDFLHVERVVGLAKKLALAEGANLDIVLPAAYLHDVVLISKNDPRRRQASRLLAEEASRFLSALNYPSKLIPAIAHAIEAHSFSANIPALTIEAKVVQDADRLDGLGAIGIARCFTVAGLLQRSFYQLEEPFPEGREVDDSLYTLDHFYAKLLSLQERLNTASARQEGLQRTRFLQSFLQQLKLEIL